MNLRKLFLLAALVLSATTSIPIQAQDDPVPAILTPVTVTMVEPATLTAGQGGVLSIFGTGFTAATTVRLAGYGLLATTFVNDGALTAEVPAGVPADSYGVEVSDPVNGSASAPAPVTILAPTTTPPPPSTPQPLPTFAPPTIVPGQPMLVARNYRADPPVIAQGGATTLTFEIVNQGNRAAQGVSVALTGESQFAPALGQAAAILPDIPPGGVVTVSLAVVAAMDAPVGVNDVPISMSYRDFEGETFSNSAALGVEITPTNLMSQIVIAQYHVEPTPAEPGQQVLVSMTVENRGNQTAAGVLVRATGEGSLLIPGSGGDTFTLGDLEPGMSVDVTFPMYVRSDAEEGPQAQPLHLIYVQNGEQQDIQTSISVEVAEVIEAQPLILLRDFSSGSDDLAPGERFTLSFTLQNVGAGDAHDVLVTFGTMEVSGGSSGQSGSGSSSGNNGSTGSNSSSTTDAKFAPVGTGNTLYAATLAAGETLTLEQEFIVNSDVESGVQSLTISVRYTTPDGSTGQTSLPASLIVIAPPSLQVDLADPLPESVNVGEPFPVALNIVNVGDDNQVIQRAELIAENADVMEGASTNIGVINENDDTTTSGLLMPSSEGTVSFTFRLVYLDALNQSKTLDYTFSVAAVEPPPPPEPEFPPNFMPTPEPTPEPDNLLGRLLLGLLGLGG